MILFKNFLLSHFAVSFNERTDRSVVDEGEDHRSVVDEVRQLVEEGEDHRSVVDEVRQLVEEGGDHRLVVDEVRQLEVDEDQGQVLQ